jgi:hypothetical protein
MQRLLRAVCLLALMVVAANGRAFGATTTVTITGSERPGDAGEITIYFNGFSETVSYGQYSTAASIASAFAGMFSRDYTSAGLCANASGAVITFYLSGTATFGPIGVTGSTTSFSVSTSGWVSEPPAPPAAPSNPCNVGSLRPELTPNELRSKDSQKLTSSKGNGSPANANQGNCPPPAQKISMLRRPDGQGGIVWQ